MLKHINIDVWLVNERYPSNSLNLFQSIQVLSNKVGWFIRFRLLIFSMFMVFSMIWLLEYSDAQSTEQIFLPILSFFFDFSAVDSGSVSCCGCHITPGIQRFKKENREKNRRSDILSPTGFKTGSLVLKSTLPFCNLQFYAWLPRPGIPEGLLW